MIILNTTINDSILNNSMIPEGCNQTTDTIIHNGSNVICYHQIPAGEIIKTVEPALYIIAGILSFLIGYLILKYLKNKYGKQ